MADKDWSVKKNLFGETAKTDPPPKMDNPKFKLLEKVWWPKSTNEEFRK